jgi:hypothetical protein
VKRNRVIVALVAATVLLLGLLVLLLGDDGKPGSQTGQAGATGSRNKLAVADTSFESWAGGGGSSAALTPAQEAMVKSALDGLGAEMAVRAAFTAGVAEPWPLTEARQLFENCVPMVERGKPVGSAMDSGVVCACAVRGMQGVYPREPPPVGTPKLRRMVSEAYRTAIDECMNP